MKRADSGLGLGFTARSDCYAVVLCGAWLTLIMVAFVMPCTIALDRVGDNCVGENHVGENRVGDKKKTSLESAAPVGCADAEMLAQVLFAYEAARRIPPSSNVTVNALHPGVVATELGRSDPPLHTPHRENSFI